MGQTAPTFFTNDSGAAGGPTDFVRDAFQDISLTPTNNSGFSSTISTNPLNNLYANDDAPRFGVKTLFIKDLVLIDDRSKWVNGQPTYQVIWNEPFSPAFGYVWGNLQLVRNYQQTYVKIRSIGDGFGVGGVIRRCQFLVSGDTATTATGTVNVDGAGSATVEFGLLNSFSDTQSKLNRMTSLVHAAANETRDIHDFRLKADQSTGTLKITGVVVYFENSGNNIDCFPGTTYNNKTRASTSAGATLAIPDLGSTLGGTSVIYKQGSGIYTTSSLAATMLATVGVGTGGAATIDVTAGHGSSFPAGTGVIARSGTSMFIGLVQSVSTDTLTMDRNLPFGVSGALYRYMRVGQSLGINASLMQLAYTFGATELASAGVTNAYFDTFGRFAIWGSGLGATFIDGIYPALAWSAGGGNGFIQVDGNFCAAEIEYIGMSTAFLHGTMTVNGFGAYSYASQGVTGLIKRTVFTDAGPGWNSFAFFPGITYANVGIHRINLYRRNWNQGITFGALAYFEQLQAATERAVNATLLAPGTYRRYYADQLPFRGSSTWVRGATTGAPGGIQYAGVSLASLRFEYFGKDFAIIGGPTANASLMITIDGVSTSTAFNVIKSVATLGFHTIGITNAGFSCFIAAIDVFRPYGELHQLQRFFPTTPPAVRDIPIITDWEPFPMNIGAVTTAPTKATTVVIDEARKRRVGDSLEITYSYSHSNATGAAQGSGIYLFPIPDNLQIDQAKQSVSPVGRVCVVGHANINNDSGSVPSDGSATNSRSQGYVVAYGATALALVTIKSGADVSGNYVASGHMGITNTNCHYSFRAVVPIAGWSSTR